MGKTISTAVGLERLSRTNGYAIQRGRFNNDTPNLPQLIAVFGEANTANQAGLTVDKVEVTSAAEAATLFGEGSPIHSMIRILRPLSGDGVGGIPTIVFPQISDVGATATEREWTVTGTATANATHTVVVNGRESLDFKSYSYSVAIGDTPTVVAAKITDAINGVTGSPCSASSALGVVTITSKWKGATSSQLDISFNLGGVASGLSYSETASIDGGGAVDLADSLSQFGDDWYTIVLNPYGATQLSSLEEFNGVPNDLAPTGRYSGLIFKPFVAYFGSTLSVRASLVAITDDAARVSQVTNALCPAPASKGFDHEAAANVVALASRTYQDSPHRDVSNFSYPDMPIPANGNIGDMGNYNDRDVLLKNGCSTVILKDGAYVVQDLVTTYHPDGEVPLQYNYARNVNLDFNVAYAYRLLEALNLMDKTVVSDGQNVDVSGVIKPKEWKGIVFSLLDELATKGLINDPQFSKDSLEVIISTTNPNRFETAFPYKRTGTVRISSTTAKAGF